MSLIPNTIATLSRHTGLNVYSEPTFSAPFKVECAVVNLTLSADVTSVRADSSASRGTIEEKIAVAKILFLPRAWAAVGDRVEIQSMRLRCISAQPRLAVTGQLDHYECEFEIWVDE